jgi:NAD(P)-dependent dehydrogenase (short-subunit alcohol dehydrogenase family)
MTVVIADRRLPEAQLTAEAITASGGRAVAMEVDVTKRDSLVALADRVDAELGGAGVLVNNAGVMPLTPILGEPEEQNWRWIFDVNVFGVVNGMQAFIPRMLAGGLECHVVSTASIAGLVSAGGSNANRIAVGDRIPEGAMWAYGYTTTKAAVVALSETLALELSGTRVGVSVLVPGAHGGGNLLENSTTNRPDEYGGSFDIQTALAAFAESVQAASSGDTPPGGHPRDPAALAQRVVRAIREGHLYIFSHPENRAEIEQRCAELMSGFDDADAFDC